MKRVISLLMAILTVITCFALAVPVLAVDEEPTTKWYQYTQEECKHVNNEDNYNYFVHDDTCYLCGYVCKHPKEYREYGTYTGTSAYLNYTSDEKMHYREFECSYCDQDGVEEGKKHSFKYTKENLYDNYHKVSCKVCSYSKTADCKYKTSYKKAGNDETHKVVKKCTICKQEGYVSKDFEKHSYKNNKCTKCGYKRIKPGKLTVKSAKCTSKGVKKNYKVDAHWEKFGGQWYWRETEKYVRYQYKIKLTVNSKNAVKYIVSSGKDITVDNSTVQRESFKKKTFTYTWNSSKNKKAKKVTLYITPVSKTGTYGKTVKKTVTLKN